jgi:protein-S-isoprenylcysteine O-methyltransferase Ste14
MIAWVNLGILILAGVLFTVFYVLSVSPARMETRIGEVAYARCARHRLVASAFEIVAVGSYVVYFFYPLPVGLARTFPWPWWVSALIAVAIGVPAAYLMFLGLRDAGEESLAPKKEHTLYGGIYDKIRHPQAVGEMPFWWVFGFALHSPFLVLFSFAWVPVFVLISWAEERDLVIRYGQAYEEYRARTGAVWPKRRAG